MNRRQLEKLGVPEYVIREAIIGVGTAAASGDLRGAALKAHVQNILNDPAAHLDDPHFAAMAQVLAEGVDLPDAPPEPIRYQTWGDQIDDGAHAQMRESCTLPSARMAALMPDAHVGYGLPIGGVLGLENAVVPYAVGVDIACRMKISILDMPVESMVTKFDQYKNALENGTRFGVGKNYERPMTHDVMDQDWTITRITRENKDKAHKQLGTSGSGNHFVEFGLFTLTEPAADLDLPVGQYVAILSHSGSRGTGASVCSTYSSIAQSRLPQKYKHFGRLAWLDMDSEAGQEYFAAMNLMGDYAAANHDIIHKNVTKLLGAKILTGVENHHNFAWKEMHDGKELIVHRKGATPAGPGVLGVIPGSMADPAFVVRGKGKAESLNSASHGAGRKMSRTKALEQFNFKSIAKDLKAKGITILSAGADEVPYVYKDIHSVMSQQQDLVDIVARFDPKIVKMCGDGSKAED